MRQVVPRSLVLIFLTVPTAFAGGGNGGSASAASDDSVISELDGSQDRLLEIGEDRDADFGPEGDEENDLDGDDEAAPRMDVNEYDVDLEEPATADELVSSHDSSFTNDDANDDNGADPLRDTDHIAGQYTDGTGWIPIPMGDWERQQIITQEMHPEDLGRGSQNGFVSAGSKNNPHTVVDKRMGMAKIGVANGNVATTGGFGPGLGYYYKNRYHISHKTQSYDEAYQSVTFDKPKSFDDLMNLPIGTTMTFSSDHYGRLVFMAGAAFFGFDAGILGQYGSTVHINRQEKKVSISFSSHGAVGVRAGLFATPLIHANLQAFKHRIVTYGFEFSLMNEANRQDIAEACNDLLSWKHNYDLANAMGNIQGSGVTIVKQMREFATEKNGRFTMGFPVLARLNAGLYSMLSKIDQEKRGVPHAIYQLKNVKSRHSRVIRRKRPGSGEPRIIHRVNNVRREALTKIDWESNLPPKLSSKITYSRQFDRISPTDLSKVINDLGKETYLANLGVNFDPAIADGSATLKLDVILEQGALYHLIRKSRELHTSETYHTDDAPRFWAEVEAHLNDFMTQDRSAINPFFDQEKQVLSPKYVRAVRATVQQLKTVMTELKDVRPKGHALADWELKELTPSEIKSRKAEIEAQRKGDIVKLGTLAKAMSKNPLLLVALDAVRNELIKYRIEIKGENMLPYVRNFR